MIHSEYNTYFHPSGLPPTKTYAPVFFQPPGPKKISHFAMFVEIAKRAANRGKGVKGCNDLLHRKKILLYMAAVGTTRFIAPCNHGSIHPHSCESGICPNHLDKIVIFGVGFSWWKKHGKLLGEKKLESPLSRFPIFFFNWHLSPLQKRLTPACWTFCKCSLTLLLSPPDSISPQVTTLPSCRTAAKACMEEAICWTAWSLSRMELLSPPLTCTKLREAPRTIKVKLLVSYTKNNPTKSTHRGGHFFRLLPYIGRFFQSFGQVTMWPQVTTSPPSNKAAKAWPVATTSRTFLRFWTLAFATRPMDHGRTGLCPCFFLMSDQGGPRKNGGQPKKTLR